jgi:hypothetical protein
VRSRSALVRLGISLAVALLPVVAFSADAAAKGTPSTITVTCGPGVASATVTVQLMSAVTNPTPASNQLVVACTATAPTATAKIAPLTQPAAAYSWSAFVTATAGTFGCGGTTSRGTTATCTNAAGGAGQVTIRAT